MEQVRRKTEERIVKIKTDTEELDKNRRTLEDKNKKERANKIQNEVIQSHKKNVEIDWNWQELEEKEDCKELAVYSDVESLLSHTDNEKLNSQLGGGSYLRVEKRSFTSVRSVLVLCNVM